MTALVRYIPTETTADAIERHDVLDGYRVREVVHWQQDGRVWLDVHTTGGVRTLAPSERVTVQRRVVEG